MIFKQSRWGWFDYDNHKITICFNFGNSVESGQLASSDLHGFHKSISEFILYSVHICFLGTCKDKFFLRDIIAI